MQGLKLIIIAQTLYVCKGVIHRVRSCNGSFVGLRPANVICFLWASLFEGLFWKSKSFYAFNYQSLTKPCLARWWRQLLIFGQPRGVLCELTRLVKWLRLTLVPMPCWVEQWLQLREILGCFLCLFCVEISASVTLVCVSLVSFVIGDWLHLFYLLSYRVLWS